MTINGQKYYRLFKILILGESSVGKTCILVRYTEKKFSKEIWKQLVLIIK